jgi:hypothetical protein
MSRRNISYKARKKMSHMGIAMVGRGREEVIIDKSSFVILSFATFFCMEAYPCPAFACKQANYKVIRVIR